MTTDDFDFIRQIGFRGRGFLLVSNQRPYLPALEAIALAHMQDGEKVVPGDDIPLPAFHIKRHKNELNFIPKKPVLQFAIERKNSRIIVFRIRSPLHEDEGEN